MTAPATIFLRDDDLGEKSPAAVAFIDVFRSRKIPVSYQVIPAHLTDECADYLRTFQREAPDLLEIGQHGLHHEMHIDGRRLSWEFGREIDYDAQRERIAQGRSILASKLGDAFDGRMFTPPRHRFNSDTVRAAAVEGYDLFSAAAYVDWPRRLVYWLARAFNLGSIANRGITYHPATRPDGPMRELSIAIAMDNGAPAVHEREQLLALIDRAARSSSIVGLMFHHAAWRTPDDQRLLGELADALLARPATTLALPRDIAVQ